WKNSASARRAWPSRTEPATMAGALPSPASSKESVLPTKLLFATLAAALAAFAAQAFAQTPAAAVPKPVPQPAAAIATPTPPPPTLDATSWLLMDYATGQVLLEGNADARVE